MSKLSEKIIRQLDKARVAKNLSKAELARFIGAKPASVRRLFSDRNIDPTLTTVIRIASALGYQLVLVPMKKKSKRVKAMTQGVQRGKRPKRRVVKKPVT